MTEPTPTTTIDPTAGHDADVDVAPHHDLLYVKVAALLAVITAAEVSLPYLADVEGPVVAAMLVMMAVKFFLVGAYFMHLKFESHLFRRVFVFGVALAAAVYVAVLSTFQFWT